MVLRRYFGKRLRNFFGDRGGNVAPIFAIAMIPVFGFVGAAVDFSRAGLARTNMQSALDATALFLSREAKGLTPEQVSAKGQEYFDSIFHSAYAKNVTLDTQFEQNGGDLTVKISAAADVDTTIARVLGYDTMPISTSSEAKWGMRRLELALVLDNTTSMASQSRMVELKKATKSLLSTLETAGMKPEDVKVAIIPYGTEVNVRDIAGLNDSWLDWTTWKAEPAIMASWLKNSSNALAWRRTGPGSSCPFSNGNQGFQCTSGVAGNSNESTVSTIPLIGTQNAGLICPSRDNGSKSTATTGVLSDRYHNGCYNSEEEPSSEWYTVATGSSASCGSNANCECNGNGRNRACVQKTYKHFWRPAENAAASDRSSQISLRATPATSTWTGCVRDRDQNYDVNDATPTSAADTKFSPVQTRNCGGSAPLARAIGLTNNWTSLNDKVDEMNTAGSTSGTRYTNITIGLAWGWHALFNNDPMSQAEEPKEDLDKVIILMTDGDNTQNRWHRYDTNNAAIDERTGLACGNFKALSQTLPGGIKLYTVRTMDGNETLLRNCATKTDMYYNVETASQLNAVFSSIAKNLASLRIAK